MRDQSKILLLCLATVLFLSCKKEVTQELSTQSLSTIQNSIAGKWKVQYTEGGLTYQRVNAVNNRYYEFSADTIKSGDDLKGETLNAKINWLKIKNPTGRSDSTFLLTYKNGLYPQELVIVGIDEGVLRIEEFAADGVATFLKRW